ncbi:MAG: ligase [Bacteroidota bacterium]|jgi:bifunctional non-homologous end joining protein LigD|nr:ligase [Bacteroidota bacterium]
MPAKKKTSVTSKPAKPNAVSVFNDKNISDKELKAILKKAPETLMPDKISPMLATLVDNPFDEPGWIYEVKWDGYRAVALCHKKAVELKSRNDKSFNDKFYPITKAFQKLNLNAVIDGEIVVVGEDGISNFGDLQNWRSEADGDLLFYAFDIMWYNGKDLTSFPLLDRKKILNAVLKENELIRVGDYFAENGIEFFEAAKDMGLEGIIAKKSDSEYHSKSRSKEWLKIKANKRQEMVIGGFTRNDDSSKTFSSLVVGVFNGENLVYAGKVGTGFNTDTQRELMKQFKPLIIKTCPFYQTPDINKPSRFRPNPPNATVTWLRPSLVCEVAFTEMTTDGILRHPSFQGMRIDKKAKDVVAERASDTKNVIHKTPGTKKIVNPKIKSERKTLLNPSDETQVRKINGHELKFTNLSKLYWTKEKITKRDLLNYYYQVAPYILPYLKDRPQSMLRHPDGINGFSFFYKNIKGKAPEWVETYKYYSEADQEEKEYLVAKDESSLLYMASLGCIEMNPWHSKATHEDFPDWCIIDLDPAKNTFNEVIEAALVTKDVLDELGVKGYPKTSGSTGIHIYIPLGAKYSYEQSKEFARTIATLVHQRIPKFTSIERAVKNRKGKMYIDFLQNRPQATVSAPYSVRPKPDATVSMPLEWFEVKKGLKMSDFHIHNAVERIRSIGDLFKPVLGKGIDLLKVVKQYEASLKK